MPQLESAFERKLVDKIKREYPGAVILKNNPNYIQGFPDRLLLYENFWAAFDTKREGASSRRPNQSYYIRKLNKMSFAQFVYPENEYDFLVELDLRIEDAVWRKSNGV